MTKTRILYKFTNNKEFSHQVIQGEDVEEGKIQKKTIFPNMQDATEIAPPSDFNPKIHKATFEDNEWIVEAKTIEGSYFNKLNGEEKQSIRLKDINLYTKEKPLEKHEGSKQEFTHKNNKWQWEYTFKSKYHLLEERKEKLLEKIRLQYEESKKITIVNGKTLTITAETPERKEFINNLHRVPNFITLNKDKDTNYLLSYWQKSFELSDYGNDKHETLLGFSARPVIWQEIFEDLFHKSNSSGDRETIFAYNKRQFALVKHIFSVYVPSSFFSRENNKPVFAKIDEIEFKYNNNSLFYKPVTININQEAEKILEKYKTGLLRPARNKKITESIQKLRGEDGKIHLIQAQVLK